MYPKAERQMLPRPRAIHQELVRPLDRVFVAITRDIPHHHLVARTDLPASNLRILGRSTPHVHDRRLPADDLRYSARDQHWILAQFAILVRMAVHCPYAARHRIARRIVSADDQQYEVPQEVTWVFGKAPRRLAMGEHRQ